jgi:hypothetical protein
MRARMAWPNTGAAPSVEIATSRGERLTIAPNCTSQNNGLSMILTIAPATREACTNLAASWSVSTSASARIAPDKSSACQPLLMRVMLPATPLSRQHHPCCLLRRPCGLVAGETMARWPSTLCEPELPFPGGARRSDQPSWLHAHAGLSMHPCGLIRRMRWKDDPDSDQQYKQHFVAGLQQVQFALVIHCACFPHMPLPCVFSALLATSSASPKRLCAQRRSCP